MACGRPDNTFLELFHYKSYWALSEWVLFNRLDAVLVSKQLINHLMNLCKLFGHVWSDKASDPCCRHYWEPSALGTVNNWLSKYTSLVCFQICFPIKVLSIYCKACLFVSWTWNSLGRNARRIISLKVDSYQEWPLIYP